MTEAFSIVPVAAALDSRLTKTHYRVLIALLSFRNKNTDTVWPSRKKLAERCGLAETRISTTTSELVKLGWLKKTGKGGYSKASEYTICVPETVTEPVTVNDETTVTKPVTVTTSVTVTEPVTTTVTEPVTKTVTEPVTRIEETNEETNEETIGKSAESWKIPSWINPQAWKEFEQHRKEIRQPLTNLARTKAAKSIIGLNAEQQQACVDETIQNRWKGLFPKNHMGKSNGPHQQDNRSRAKRVADKLDEIARRDISENGFSEVLG